MKRLSYITMIFLPATFVSVRQFLPYYAFVLIIILQHAFGMNVTELNPGGYTTLAVFLEAMLPLTFFTIWIIVAFQSRLVLRDENGSMWKKLLWPITILNTIFSRRSTPKNDGLGYELALQQHR
jgi:hypothetical protein